MVVESEIAALARDVEPAVGRYLNLVEFLLTVAIEQRDQFVESLEAEVPQRPNLPVGPGKQVEAAFEDVVSDSHRRVDVPSALGLAAQEQAPEVRIEQVGILEPAESDRDRKQRLQLDAGHGRRIHPPARGMVGLSRFAERYDTVQNETFGACRISGDSMSSRAAGWKLNMPATMLEGNTSRRLL